MLSEIEKDSLGFIKKNTNNLFFKCKGNTFGDERYDSPRYAIKCSFSMMNFNENIDLDVEKVSSNSLESKATKNFLIFFM